MRSIKPTSLRERIQNLFQIDNLAKGLVGLSALSFVVLGASSSVLKVDALDIAATVGDTGDAYVSLSVVNTASCPNSNSINLGVLPSSQTTGTMSSDCATVRVDTSKVTGYSLTIKNTQDQKLHRTTSPDFTLDPLPGATPDAPKTMQANTWGWAVPGVGGFNPTYTKETNKLVSASTSKWAAAPTASAPFFLKQSTQAITTNPEDYNVYFATAANMQTPSGAYSGSVTFTASSEGLVKPADPVSTGMASTDPAMIPVAYVGSTSGPVWVKADVNNGNISNTVNSNGGNYNWFDYANKKWANSVTVSSASRATYKNAAAGTVINQGDVVGYWTYIPRYRYKTWTTTYNTTNYPKAIDIQIEDCQSNGTTCTASGYNKATVAGVVSGGAGSWVTHPAFTYNGHELNGLWVGKYESTGTAAAPTVLPDQTAVNSSTISAMFNGAVNVANSGGTGTHGLDSTKGDTRLFNDQTWGAVAYLSQSVYGVCSNSNCSETNTAPTSLSPANQQKVWNNGTYNSSGSGCPGGNLTKTGYGNAGKDDTYKNTVVCDSTNAYYSTNGQLASSTNNPTGVYDLAGGNWEYVLANAGNNLGSSGFSSMPAAKYTNVYGNPPIVSNNNADIINGNYNLTSNNTITLGTATYETGGNSSYQGWNGDSANSVNSSNPWSVRGGNSSYTTNAGVFAANSIVGGAYASFGSRLLQSAP